MSDTTQILSSVGAGVYTAVGTHFYSILVSRAKSDAIRAMLFLLFIVFFIVGGFIGCVAIAGGIHDTGQKPTAHDNSMRAFTLLTWSGIVLIYIIFNWRALQQRLKSIK